MLIELYELSLFRIRKEQKQFTDRITNGSISSFEEYRHICGILRGMKYAEEILMNSFNDIQTPKNKQKEY